MDDLIHEWGVTKGKLTTFKCHLSSFTTDPKEDILDLKRRLAKAEDFFAEFETKDWDNAARTRHFERKNEKANEEEREKFEIFAGSLRGWEGW